jgi:hypothetical protein
MTVGGESDFLGLIDCLRNLAENMHDYYHVVPLFDTTLSVR